MFGYRVAAVAVHRGHVLLHRSAQDDFWSLPGGRCELWELAQDALRREMREEMGIDVHVGRLLWVVENLFEQEGVAHHELGLYFKVDLGPDFGYNCRDSFEGSEEGLRLTFRWFPLASVRGLRLYPVFLQASLASLPSETEHIVNVEPAP